MLAGYLMGLFAIIAKDRHNKSGFYRFLHLIISTNNIFFANYLDCNEEVMGKITQMALLTSIRTRS